MFSRMCISMAAVASLGLVLAHAAEPVKSQGSFAGGAVAAPAPSPAEIAGWIKQLDADEYDLRETAQEKLSAAGKAVIPDLAKAAVGGSLEVTTRSIEVLKKFYASSDQATKKAAKASLETLAKSSNPAAARRAAQVVQAPAKPGDPNNIGGGGGIQVGRIVINGGGGVFGIQGNVQVVAGPAGGGPKVTTKITDGVKDIEAEDNGKTIKIHDDPNKGIKIEVTSKKAGKDVTQKFEAKNAADLKKTQPEAYKLYQKYAANQVNAVGGAGAGGIQVQGQGGQIQLQFNVVPGGGFGPGGFAPAPAPAPVPPRAHGVTMHGGAAIDRLTAQIKACTRRLEVFGEGAKLAGAPQEAKDELRKEIKTLKQRLADIEKSLGQEPAAGQGKSSSISPAQSYGHVE